MNAKDNDGWTPLMYAARFSTTEACQKLIAAGAEVNAKDKKAGQRCCMQQL